MKVRNNTSRLRLPAPGLRRLATATALLAAGVYAEPGRAQDEQEIPFDEAIIFFELNDTDGDLGIHALVDGDAWRLLNIWTPNEVKLLNILVTGRLRRQGLTEIFFESAEPPFDELAPEQFFNRFPPGEYEIEGLTLEGEELESTVELSHVMPAPPVVRVSGRASAENCDAVPLPIVPEPAVLRWNEITRSHPEIGTPNVDVEVEHYEVVIEAEESTLSVTLPPDVTQFRVPTSLTESGDEIKFEVIVREENGNQTAVESCYIVR
jgi:hypothetical protein